MIDPQPFAKRGEGEGLHRADTKPAKAAMEKLAKFASDVIDQAEKANINQDARDRLEYLANDNLPYCLGDRSSLRVAGSGDEDCAGV